MEIQSASKRVNRVPARSSYSRFPDWLFSFGFTEALRLDWMIVAILGVAAVLRLWGIGFGLPYMVHPDENVPVSIALRMLRTGNFNPEFFHWPSLLIYLNALAYFIFFLVGKFSDRFSTLTDLPFPEMEAMAVGKATMPEIVLLGRGLSAVFGVLSVWIVYLIGRQIDSRPAGWIAAFLFAVETVAVKNSHFIRPDTLAVFFALVAVFFALKIVADPRATNYILAGASAGLAASSKYNLALVFIALIAAHTVQFGLREFVRREMLWSVLASGFAFFVATPYSIFDWTRFWQIGPPDDAAIYSTGHPGAEGNTIQWYADFLIATQGAIIFLAICGATWLLFRRERKGMVLLSFPVFYYGFVNFYVVHFDTTILPVIPFVILLASAFLARIYDIALSRLPSSKVWASTALVAVVGILAWAPLQASAANDARISKRDGRDQAREWIDASLPIGARIVVESYSPYIDPRRFTVQGQYGIQDREPDWYIANGFEYLVFSQGVYGRYYDDPARYAAEVSRYNALFSRFQSVAKFDENGFEVRIYRTGVTLPSMRVAARFGNDADLVELVGYDAPLHQPVNEPLRVKLYWRTLRAKQEPLELEMILRAQDDREISKVRGDLFQGKGWPPGIFSTEWSVPASARLTTGLYHLEINVVQTRFSYVTPATSWAEEKLDQVSIGPFTLDAVR